jgi:hypothetical protein
MKISILLMLVTLCGACFSAGAGRGFHGEHQTWQARDRARAQGKAAEQRTPSGMPNRHPAEASP